MYESIGKDQPFWYWENEIPEQICNDIIESAGESFSVGALSGEAIVDETKRKQLVHWTNAQWLYDLIWPYMTSANKQAGWNFDINTSESIQIGKYEGDGGHYDYHVDGLGTWGSVYNNPNESFCHNRTRKLSMSILLNNDFEGGDFEFFNYDNPPRGTGSIVVFPSFLHHRVVPVTSGTRYSMVAWFLGPPLR